MATFSPKAAWFLLIVCAVLVISVVAAFVVQLNNPAHPDLGFFYVIICVAMGLVTAVATFGFFKSIGKITGKEFGAQWEFGGPIAVVIFFFIVGV